MRTLCPEKTMWRKINYKSSYNKIIIEQRWWWNKEADDMKAKLVMRINYKSNYNRIIMEQRWWYKS